MASNTYARLISGSDLRGVALEGYGKTVTLTPDDAAAAAYAFAAGLGEGASVAVGRDSRLSGEALRDGVFRGLAAAGAKAIDCGIATTPAMFLSTIGEPFADGAIMITASHLPAERNGLKFFTPKGGLSSSEIRALTENMRPVEGDMPLGVSSFDLIGRYAASLRDFIAWDNPRPLVGMNIAVDAGNGSGGFFAGVLEDLGAKVTGLYLEPDGHFPNHAPNPEEAAALSALSAAVRENHCDLGIIFDADCDRAALADGQGNALNRDRLVALVSSYVLEEHPGATIVTDSVTSTGLTRYIEGLGGVHRRFRRGYRNVIDEAMRLRDAGVNCPAAIETSGHCALGENHFLDDGMYLAAYLLRRFAKDRRWEERLDVLALPAEDIEIRLSLIGQDFAGDGEAALALLHRRAEEDARLHIAPDSAEGIRVHCPEGGWFMVRRSVHDPVLAVNIQADKLGGAVAMALRLSDMLMGASGVEFSPLVRYAGDFVER